jgi:hypothetical protein
MCCGTIEVNRALTLLWQKEGMQSLPTPIEPEHWQRQLFIAQAAADGEIVRRKVRDVERIVGRQRFAADLRRRGFRAVENAGQFVIFCNCEPVILVR